LSIDFSVLKKLKILDLSSQNLNGSFDLSNLKLPESLEFLFLVSNSQGGGVFGGGFGGAHNNFNDSIPKLKEKFPNLQVFLDDIFSFIQTRKPENDILDLISQTKKYINSPNFNYNSENLLQYAITNEVSLPILESIINLKCDPNVTISSTTAPRSPFSGSNLVTDENLNSKFKDSHRIINPYYPMYPMFTTRSGSNKRIFFLTTFFQIFLNFFFIIAGWSSVHLSLTKKSKYEYLKILFENGGEVDSRIKSTDFSNQITPLMLASFMGDEPLIV
jgi:hypothetical protein